MWIRAFEGGWHLDILSPSDKIPVREYDFGAMVPRQVEKNREAVKRFHTLLIGGAPVSAVLERELATFPGKIYLTYGMTETLTHVAVSPLTKAAACGKLRPGIFHALPMVRFSAGNDQCLEIKDQWLDLSLQVNDRVEVISPTRFRWLSRCDHVINTGGIKVFPETVEKKLEAFFPERFIITSLPDEQWSNRIVLVLEGPERFVSPEIFEKAGLAYFEKPKEIYFLPAFPETPSGKIKRHAVQELLRR